MYCVKCGTQVAKDLRFCTQCGAALQEADPVLPAAPRANPDSKARTITKNPSIAVPVPTTGASRRLLNKTVVWSIAGIVVVTIIAIVVIRLVYFKPPSAITGTGTVRPLAPLPATVSPAAPPKRAVPASEPPKATMPGVIREAASGRTHPDNTAVTSVAPSRQSATPRAPSSNPYNSQEYMQKKEKELQQLLNQ